MTNSMIDALAEERDSLTRACEADLAAAPSEDRVARVEKRMARIRVIDERLRELRAAGVPSTDTAEHRGGRALAAELRALAGSGTTNGGAFTPTEFGRFMFDRLRAQSVMMAAGARVITTNRDTLVVPHLTGSATAAFVSEGSQIGDSALTAAQVTATPRKLASRTVVSSEALADSDPSLLDIIANDMVQSMAAAFDLAAFEGSGTPPAIRGLANVSGIQTGGYSGNGSVPADVDKFISAVTGLLTEGVVNQPVMVMHPRTWGTLASLKDLQDRPLVMESLQGAFTRRLLGAPVFLSNQLSITETTGSSTDTTSVYLFDPSEVVVVLRTDTRIEVDSSRLFDYDQSEVRAIMRADLVVPNPKAVYRITGIRA